MSTPSQTYPAWEQPLADAETWVSQKLGMIPQTPTQPAQPSQQGQPQPQQPPQTQTQQQAGTVPLLGPDGQIHAVPQNQLQQALAAGGKQVSKMLDPQGTARWVTLDQMQSAIDAGGTPWDDYREATRSGPYAPAGAAERAMGQQFGGNREQAIESLKAVGMATAATAGGIAGVTSAGPALYSAGATALSNPIVQQGLKMAGQQLLKTAVGAGRVALGYKLLKMFGMFKGPAAAGAE